MNDYKISENYTTLFFIHKSEEFFDVNPIEFYMGKSFQIKPEKSAQSVSFLSFFMNISPNIPIKQELFVSKLGKIEFFAVISWSLFILYQHNY